jgi:hypothetical protein
MSMVCQLLLLLLLLAHLHKSLVSAVDLICKDVEQHLAVTVSLQVPAQQEGR